MRERKQKSFSSLVKEELTLAFLDKEEQHYILLGLSFIFNGSFRDKKITFSSTNEVLLNLLKMTLSEQLGISSSIAKGKRFSVLHISKKEDRKLFLRFLSEDFGFTYRHMEFLKPEWITPDPDFVKIREPKDQTTLIIDEKQSEEQPNDRKEKLIAKLKDEEKQYWICVLQSITLSSSTILNPRRTCKIELLIRPCIVATQIYRLLKLTDFRPEIIKKKNRYLITISLKEKIGDFLALIGAHEARLMYEDISIEKEIRNQVNRVVNCDTANMNRVAEAAINQIHYLSKLKEHEKWNELTDELKMIANIRLENPAFSLSELGQNTRPIMTKSMVYSRLKKLEMLYGEINNE